MNDSERRVLDHARRLWEEAGRPQSGITPHLGRARELVAIEDNWKLALGGLLPGETAGSAVPDAGPAREPVEAVENAGEFPTLPDQGEQKRLRRRGAA